MKKIFVSNSKIKFYKKYGYLILRNVLSKKEIAIINKRLNFLEKSQKDGRGLSEPGLKKSLIYSLHKDKVFINIIENKKWFQESAKRLLGCEKISCWNAKSNLKKRWNGSVEYYHQDFIYWRALGFQSSNMLNCMIFIDDHQHLNGGLWIFSGSHKTMFEHTKFMNINSLQKYFIHPKLLDKISKKHKPLSISAKSGSCLFFHSRLIHGSSHNISQYDRKILLYDIANKDSVLKANISKIKTFNRKERIKFEKRELLKRIANL